MQAQVQKVIMLPRCDIFENITRVLHLRRKYVFWGQVEVHHRLFQAKPQTKFQAYSAKASYA